jgi:hypothetical protein
LVWRCFGKLSKNAVTTVGWKPTPKDCQVTYETPVEIPGTSLRQHLRASLTVWGWIGFPLAAWSQISRGVLSCYSCPSGGPATLTVALAWCSVAKKHYIWV